MGGELRRGTSRWRRLALAAPLAVGIALLGATMAGAVALHGLTPKGCISDAGDPTGCGATAQGLTFARNVALSSDGASVYVVSVISSNAIVRFDRAANGALTNAGCINDVGMGGCGSTAQGLNDSRAVAVSPDGASVFTVAAGDRAIVRFAREVPPICRTSSSTGAPGASQTIPLDCFDPNDDPQTISVVKAPVHGTLGAINQGAKTVTYTPAGGFTGVDSFDIRATADGKQSNVSTVVVGVFAAPVQVAPSPPVQPKKKKKKKKKKKR